MKKDQEDEEESLDLSRKPLTMSNFEVSSDISNEIGQIYSTNGSSLDNHTRRFMESRFGSDFLV